VGRPAFLLRVSRMKVFSKLKKEFFKILPPTIYFFVALRVIGKEKIVRIFFGPVPARKCDGGDPANTLLIESDLLANKEWERGVFYIFPIKSSAVSTDRVSSRRDI
jgi:hypothetical protein